MTGEDACLVIGQRDFISNAESSELPGLWGPQDLHFDHTGDLWVADFIGHRILEYVPPFSTGMGASLAIPEASPIAFSLDLQGNLYVADFANSRALIYDAPLSESSQPAVTITDGFRNVAGIAVTPGTND